jgi:hypothetical protein
MVAGKDNAKGVIHATLTAMRPVAVRGLPVLGLNARGSGHHYRQEV